MPGAGLTPGQLNPADLREVRDRIERFLMAYEAGIDEIETKLRILQREFAFAQDYNPIEHITSRLKSMESLTRKATLRGCTSLAEIREEITDIAGIRVVCSFTSDVYRVAEILQAQDDVEVVQVKDYVARPKANGYRSLHLVVRIPVFLSSEVQMVPVEVQFRTIAMDFWASLEHKIYYKYGGEIPQQLLDGLSAAASTAARLDEDMAQLHDEIRVLREADPDDELMTVDMFRAFAMMREV